MKLVVFFFLLHQFIPHAHACSSRPTLRLYSGYASHGQAHLQPAVRTLQSLLNGRGYSLAVDGYFGPGTEGVVRSWQARSGLVVDGIVGQNTWASLCDSATTAPPPTTTRITTTTTTVVTTNPSRSVCSVRPTLKRNAGYSSYGMAHLQWAVLALQRMLTARGFSVKADGKFGSNTEGAVKRYQFTRGLKPDGIVGKNTWAKLCSSSDSRRPPPSPLPKCLAPNFKCGNGRCVRCREVGGTLRLKMFVYRRGLRKLSFLDRARKFYNIVKTGGEGDLKNNIFKNDCCVRIFGTPVANDVPGNILYGFIGLEVFNEEMLLAAAGYVHVNKQVSISKAVFEIGLDLGRAKFKWCKVKYVSFIRYPCSERSKEAAWNKVLNGWAAKDDPKDQQAILVGTKVAIQLLGRRDLELVQIGPKLTFEVKRRQGVLRKCC